MKGTIVVVAVAVVLIEKVISVVELEEVLKLVVAAAVVLLREDIKVEEEV